MLRIGMDECRITPSAYPTYKPAARIATAMTNALTRFSI
jgi:hypothetical protein